MVTAGIKAAAYCLNFAPELALHYGGTPAQERKSKPDSEFLRALPEHAQTYEEAQAYAPNLTYFGAMMISVRRLCARPSTLSLLSTGINSPRPQGKICKGFTP